MTHTPYARQRHPNALLAHAAHAHTRFPSAPATRATAAHRPRLSLPAVFSSFPLPFPFHDAFPILLFVKALKGGYLADTGEKDPLMWCPATRWTVSVTWRQKGSAPSANTDETTFCHEFRHGFDSPILTMITKRGPNLPVTNCHGPLDHWVLGSLHIPLCEGASRFH